MGGKRYDLDGRVPATANSEAGEGPLRRTRGMVLTTKNPFKKSFGTGGDPTHSLTTLDATRGHLDLIFSRPSTHFFYLLRLRRGLCACGAAL